MAIILMHEVNCNKSKIVRLLGQNENAELVEISKLEKNSKKEAKKCTAAVPEKTGIRDSLPQR
jgi:hypothetical protein